MAKKRLMFTLLYCEGNFMLSRNFRLQAVGDIFWLNKNYDFKRVASYIDELIVLDVSRNRSDNSQFLETLQRLASYCFVPIAAGGGINSVEAAASLLRSGADKIVLNSSFYNNPSLARDLALIYGRQCVVRAIDIKRLANGEYEVYEKNGSQRLPMSLRETLVDTVENTVGEYYLNSMDQDGTGQGYDLAILEHLPDDLGVPVIYAGGVGHAKHFVEGLQHPSIDAAATANLFNFVGSGLKNARKVVQLAGIDLAKWPDPEVLKENLALR